MGNRIGILFISNGRVIPKNQEDSLEPIRVSSFLAPCLWAANQLGLQLYQGVNRTYASQLKSADYQITFYNQHIYRNIFDWNTIRIGYRNLCHFLEDHPNIEVIHCNTPIGGVLGRICGKKYNKKVVYTAHGFHFYKGAPLLNRTLFKWVERWLAHKTDCLITINQEDYEAAQQFKLSHKGKVFKTNGVGIDLQAFSNVNVDIEKKLGSLDVPVDSIVGIVVGDLNENKNVGTIIRAMPMTNERIHLLICGLGPLENALKALAAEVGVGGRCHFLGFRTDVYELYKCSDIFVFASQREGLPRSTMEAMLAGLPCVVSNIRGNVDLVDDHQGGIFFPPKNARLLAEAMSTLADRPDVRKQYGAYNEQRIKQFDIAVVKRQMLEIYKEVLQL